MATGFIALGVVLSAACVLAVLAVVWEGVRDTRQPDPFRPGPGGTKPRKASGRLEGEG